MLIKNDSCYIYNGKEQSCKAYILSQAPLRWEFCEIYSDGGYSGVIQIDQY